MKKVYVFEKNKLALKFLKDFFKGSREYSARFYTDEGKLKALKKGCHALILGAPDYAEKINLSEIQCPLIATVLDVTKGMRSIIKHNIESYLIYPFHKDDLEYKLRSVYEKRGWIEKLYTEKKDLEAIADITYHISSSLNPKEVLFFVVKRLSSIINVTRCSVLSIGVGEHTHATVVSSFEDPKIKDIKLDLKKYPEIRKALRIKKTVIVKDAMTDPIMKPIREIIKPIGIKSIVVIPVIFRDEVIGSLFLRTSRAGHIFTDREIKLCSAIAKASATALYNAFLFEKLSTEKAKLEKLAITDFLTGVYNIRYLYHRLDEEFSRSQRYNSPLSCIMFDIDYFKAVNDTYGHRIGDIVLREFAQLIKRHTRKSDVFARYGGEEFILLLSHTSLRGAVSEGKRLSRVVKEHRFKEIGDKRLTVSMGVSSCPHKRIKTQDDLITFADSALFEAKNKGRDKVVVFK
ncbi:MAG: sensor domain-containing diguanylate cyclase [Nitrospirae bacterium]|nr:sensor domain-containing diguanylate cyclase [Nitrospirota bacterium]